MNWFQIVYFWYNRRMAKAKTQAATDYTLGFGTTMYTWFETGLFYDKVDTRSAAYNKGVSDAHEHAITVGILKTDLRLVQDKLEEQHVRELVVKEAVARL